jgi:DNA-binding NarL/FixJ family response regulator
MITDQTIKVAIVEDIQEIREALRVLINGSAGYQCIHTFRDAEEALDNMPSYDVDVVLMDISLPRMNGIECMKILKTRMPGAQFMMCSVHDDDDHIFNALQSGASGYILKRTSPAQILEAINDINAGGSPMSGEIARRVVAMIQRQGTPSQEAELLTDREKEILDLLSQGYLYKEIAEQLFISKLTVKKHIHNIYDKLQVQNRTEALNRARRR